jgi:hypothetical protein
MRTHACREWREEITAFVLSERNVEQSEGLEQHLRSCGECRALHARLLAEETRLRVAFTQLSARRVGTGLSSPSVHVARADLTRQARVTRLLVPFLATAAAAAALAVALGLWPSASSIRRAYGMTDLPRLLQGAILHMTGKRYSNPNPDDDDGEMLPVEYWYDLAQGRSRSPYYFYTWRGDHYAGGYGEQINDGSFILTLNHTDKTAKFVRLDDYARVLERRRTFDALFRQFLAGRDQLAEFEKVAEEQIDGVDYDVWALTSSGYKLRCALGGASGEIGYIRESFRRRNGNWREFEKLGRWRRFESAPAGVFDTTPPADYTLKNTKDTAEAYDLRYCNSSRSSLPVRQDGYISFRLPDNSIILAWSSRDMENDASQEDLFADLEFGGDLPKLPYEIIGLRQRWGDEQVEYIGRHVAWTRSGETFVEWGLYVPRSNLVLPEWYSEYSAVSTFNLPPGRVAPPLDDFVGGLTSIDNDADFDLLVRGAMAELSGGQPAPPEVRFQDVMDLAARVREELQRSDGD